MTLRLISDLTEVWHLIDVSSGAGLGTMPAAFYFNKSLSYYAQSRFSLLVLAK